MIDFNKIVNKLGKVKGEFIDIEDIADIVDPDFRDKPLSQRAPVYKILYRLKAGNILTPIKQGLYHVSLGEDVNIEGIIEDGYWRIIKKILSRETQLEYFISGTKALELHMKDYSGPKKLLVSGKENTKNLQISNTYSLSIRPITSGKKTQHKNAYPLLKKYTELLEIEGERLRVACPELALLDTLLVRDTNSGIDQYLIEKFLKRSSRMLRREVLGVLVSTKYITAINRLRSITKDTKNTIIYEMCIDIIKQEGGGCFITHTKK